MFPIFDPPQDHASFEEFAEQQVAAEEKAYDEPIKLPLSLPILYRCSDPAFDELLGLDQPASQFPPKPMVPSEYRTPHRSKAFDPSENTSDFRVILTDAIRPQRLWKRSGIYRAHIKRSDTVGEGMVACVKLYQQSKYGVPDWRTMKPGSPWNEDWIPATRIAQCEAWVYDRLTDIQGSIVPHSYGFYVFRLPTGEEVIGHVMEMLSGIDGQKYFDQIEDDRAEVLKFADAMAWAVSEIHARGVVHSDMRPPNMHVYKNPSSLSVCIFDFDLSRAPLYQTRGNQPLYHMDGNHISSIMTESKAFRAAEEDFHDLVGYEDPSVRRAPWAQIFSSFR